MTNPIVQIVNILSNDPKQELVMRKGWPDGGNKPGHNDRLQWGLTVFQVGILLQTYKPKICCELWKEVIFNETLGRNFVLLPLQRKLYRNIFHILQPQALIFGYLLLLNLKVWNVLVPKYFLAFEEADINQLLFSDDWWVSSTFWKKIFLKSNIRP